MRVVLIAAVSLLVSSACAFAEPKCNPGPEDKWLPEAEMKAKAAAMGYMISVFKKTTGNCYEIYGKNASGKRVEVYFNPVTGEPVKYQ
jgi:hypothetical protein